MVSSAAEVEGMQECPPVQLESLVEEAYRDPRRMRDVILRAYELGGGSLTTVDTPSRKLAARLRRKAKVVLEFDGRSALLEMAAELDGQ